MIVSPIASPAIDLNVPRDRQRGEDDPDEEERQDRLEPTPLRGRSPLQDRHAGVEIDWCPGKAAERERGEDGAGELRDPVDDRERGAIRRVTRKPSVTAGLKWPPEM